jgi:hypothetical protein
MDAVTMCKSIPDFSRYAMPSGAASTQALVIGSLATGDILTKYFARSGNARAGSPKILTPWLPELPKVVPTSPACAA